jgi:hypothetical protein
MMPTVFLNIAKKKVVQAIDERYKNCYNTTIRPDYVKYDESQRRVCLTWIDRSRGGKNTCVFEVIGCMADDQTEAIRKWVESVRNGTIANTGG